MCKELIDIDVQELRGDLARQDKSGYHMLFFDERLHLWKHIESANVMAFDLLILLHCDGRLCEDAPTTLERERQVHTPVTRMVHVYSTDQMQGIRKTCFDCIINAFIASSEHIYR